MKLKSFCLLIDVITTEWITTLTYIFLNCGMADAFSKLIFFSISTAFLLFFVFYGMRGIVEEKAKKEGKDINEIEV